MLPIRVFLEGNGKLVSPFGFGAEELMARKRSNRVEEEHVPSSAMVVMAKWGRTRSIRMETRFILVELRAICTPKYSLSLSLSLSLCTWSPPLRYFWEEQSEDSVSGWVGVSFYTGSTAATQFFWRHWNTEYVNLGEINI